MVSNYKCCRSVVLKAGPLLVQGKSWRAKQVCLPAASAGSADRGARCGGPALRTTALGQKEGSSLLTSILNSIVFHCYLKIPDTNHGDVLLCFMGKWCQLLAGGKRLNSAAVHSHSNML
ncbi:unnamed protein product [Eretmochelys imbricata]